MRSASGRAASAASREQRRRVDALGLQLQLAERDPADVEQVVDQAHQVAELSLAPWRGPPANASPSVGASCHDRDRVADRRQRIAQLVRQHRQELVLAPRRLAQLIGVALALGDVDRGRDQEAPAVGVGAAPGR